MKNYKTYNYQLVRYIHNQSTSEFVNVGVIVYDQESNFLKSCFLKKFDRVSNFFNDEPNIEYLKIVLNHFENEVNENKNTPKIDFGGKVSCYDNISNLTSLILPKDDSALQCSEVFRGIDIDIDSALMTLFNEFVNKYSY